MILDDQLSGDARVYRDPLEVVRVHDPLEVWDAFARLEAHRRAGRHLAGWLAYGLGAAVEPALAHTLPNDDAPLLEVGVFERVERGLPRDLRTPDAELGLALEPVWSAADYAARFADVQVCIREGGVYQVNLCFPLRGQTEWGARALYRNLRRRQPAAYGGLASLGGPEIVSLSPELFVEIEGGQATLRPMKGTAAREANLRADRRVRDALREDEKSRAENLMIVDLLRNDLSRLAAPGTVAVPQLFEIETYPTVHQMVSTVTGRVGDPSLREIVRALFPCGSVTGAPKIAAMQLIHALEPGPRGPYCGSLFCMEPPGKSGLGSSRFNVAIRTLVKRGERLDYWVGSGVVADSDAEAEYAECLLKARVLRPPPPHLVETLRLGPRGFVRLGRHLNRMERSARALGLAFDPRRIADALTQVEPDSEPQRVRIELMPGSRAEVSVGPLIRLREPLRLVPGSRPLSPEVQPTAHKTHLRAFYQAELARAKDQGADEAILLNAAGEVCEGTFTSVFVERGGRMLTPALESGPLPGVLREQLLDEGRAEEAVLRWQDVLEADAVWVGNSLRGLMVGEVV